MNWQLDAKILELAIGTLKIESGACDLAPGGSKKELGHCAQVPFPLCLGWFHQASQRA